MSALIRNRQIIANDAVTLADDDALPAAGRVIVSLARWQAEAAGLKASGLDVGVQLPNTVEVTGLWPEIADRSLIVLSFPAFGDGRAYSQATLLRSRCGYTGELRAVGAAVVRDQIAMMARCGFDSFVLRDDQDPAVCLTAFEDFHAAYQPAVDAVVPVWKRRRAVGA